MQLGNVSFKSATVQPQQGQQTPQPNQGYTLSLTADQMIHDGWNLGGQTSTTQTPNQTQPTAQQPAKSSLLKKSLYTIGAVAIALTGIVLTKKYTTVLNKTISTDAIRDALNTLHEKSTEKLGENAQAIKTLIEENKFKEAVKAFRKNLQQSVEGDHNATIETFMKENAIYKKPFQAIAEFMDEKVINKISARFAKGAAEAAEATEKAAS